MPAPPVKTVMGKNLQMADCTDDFLSWTSELSNAQARQAIFQRQDQPQPGTAGTQC